MITLLLSLFLSTADPQVLLDQMAQAHAERMVDRDPMVHSNIAPLFLPEGPCEWAGEVMYSGTDISGASRWALYAASPAHAQVVAIPRTHHGVGSAVSTSGRVVFVDIFCRVPQAATAPQTTTTVPQPVTTAAQTSTPAPSSGPAPEAVPEPAAQVLVVRAVLCPSLFQICVD